MQVVTPTKLNRKEEDLIKQFAGTRRPQRPELTHFQQGLFDKLRDRFLNL